MTEMLKINFPDRETMELFARWLCNAGEQDFENALIYLGDSSRHFDFKYYYRDTNTIIVKEVEGE